ncbi:MAG: helix-turn-helix domain-containing protein [Bacteroidota bacterium]
MKDRILQIIKEEGLTNTRFAQEIGVQPSSISHIVSGRNKASIELITKILHRFPGINTDWLMLGKGEMYKTNQPERSVQTQNKQATTDLFSQPSAPEAKPDSPLDQSNEPGINPDPGDSVKSEDPPPYERRKPSAEQKRIEKIVVFYSDKTFSEYNPG